MPELRDRSRTSSVNQDRTGETANRAYMLWTRKAGVLLTLEDTVEFFNLIDGTKLTPQEKQDLVAFLRALCSRRRCAPQDGGSSPP
jgi:hypothetical protein